VEPLRDETFHFTRRWMQRQAWRVSDMRGQDFRTGRSLNLPPQYPDAHRVLGGSTGILCQLDAESGARHHPAGSLVSPISPQAGRLSTVAWWNGFRPCPAGSKFGA